MKCLGLGFLSDCPDSKVIYCSTALSLHLYFIEYFQRTWFHFNREQDIFEIARFCSMKFFFSYIICFLNFESCFVEIQVFFVIFSKRRPLSHINKFYQSFSRILKKEDGFHLISNYRNSNALLLNINIYLDNLLMTLLHE